MWYRLVYEVYGRVWGCGVKTSTAVPSRDLGNGAADNRGYFPEGKGESYRVRLRDSSSVKMHFFGASGLLSRIGLFELIHQLKIPNRARVLYPNRVYTFPESGKLRFPESVNEFPVSGLAPNFVQDNSYLGSGFTISRIGNSLFIQFGFYQYPNRVSLGQIRIENFTIPNRLSSKPSYPLEGDLFVENEMSREVISMGSESRPPVLVMGEYAQWKLRMIHFLDQLDRNLIKSIRAGPVRPTVTIAEVPETATCPLLPSYTPWRNHTTCSTKNNANTMKSTSVRWLFSSWLSPTICIPASTVSTMLGISGLK
ncbi:hypothetical protein OSB04_001344 [Centaurea solstitialis]|uniref:Uncharacterized protein n=1 Tax=Centaurea solstitialis TaxID=347529 RepID=A0AA38TQT8_9ASTR|nr:hypothetical protein OSB04_001344 [Centaurea solstitialis]